MKNQRGASAIEFAIVFPLLVLLLFGIIEFSLILYDKVMITNASREGARAGIVVQLTRMTESVHINELTGNSQAVSLIEQENPPRSGQRHAGFE